MSTGYRVIQVVELTIALSVVELCTRLSAFPCLSDVNSMFVLFAGCIREGLYIHREQG